MWNYKVLVMGETVLDSSLREEFSGYPTEESATRVAHRSARDNGLVVYGVRTWTDCKHEGPRIGLSSGGDAESGPITVTQCKACGKRIVQYGM
jgi:hypothetical protein